MKKIVLLVMAVLLCMTFSFPVFAATNPDAVIDPAKTGGIYIDYKDDVEGTDPISGAEFTAYRVAVFNSEGGYEPLVYGLKTISDDTDPEQVLALIKHPKRVFSKDKKPQESHETIGVKTVTNKKGRASFQALELGLYLVEESKPATDHFASKPFFVSVPHTDNNRWEYSITVEPKALPAGKLIVSKKVESMLDDKEKKFHFTVTFENFEDKVHFTRSDKKQGYIKSGDTVTLKHGESILFDMIPVGTAYQVTEKEADSDGYITTASNASGNIRRTEILEAAFVNSQTPPPTGDDYFVYITGAAAVAFLATSLILLLKLRGMKEGRKME